MGLFKRITDIISANMEEMVSGAENPEPILKQAVGEMEDSIADATQATARAMANEKLIRQRLAEHEAKAKQCQDQAEQAVKDGSDDAARDALKRKGEHTKIAAALSDQLAATSESVTTLRRQLEAMRAKLAEAKRSLATLSARHRAAQVRREAVDPVVKTDAFAKFDRMSEKVQMAEAEADAMRELAGDVPVAAGVDVAVEPVAVDAEVESELADLKKKAKR